MIFILLRIRLQDLFQNAQRTVPDRRALGVNENVRWFCGWNETIFRPFRSLQVLLLGLINTRKLNRCSDVDLLLFNAGFILSYTISISWLHAARGDQIRFAVTRLLQLEFVRLVRQITEIIQEANVLLFQLRILKNPPFYLEHVFLRVLLDGLEGLGLAFHVHS